MSNRELQLISRIVRTGDLSPVIEWGITTDDFLTNEGLAMWNHINGYFTRPDTVGSVFGPNVFQEFYPTFILTDDGTMTTDALCSEVRNNRISVDVNVICQKALELAGSDPVGAMTYLNDRSSEGIQLGTSQQTDIFFGDSFEDILRRYELRKAGVDLSICSFPWDPLNKEVGGLDPVDYMVLYGRPKCVPVGTEILTSSGEFKPIEDITTAMGVRHQTQEMGWVRVEHKTEIVRRKVVRVRTRSGYEATVGEDHPLLRPNFQYTEAGKLSVGDHIGVAGQIPWPVTGGRDPNYYEMLGLLAGDGNYTRNEVQFTNVDTNVVERLRGLVKTLGCLVNPNKENHYRIIRDENHEKNHLLDALRGEKMWGKKSPEKTAPQSLFKEPQDCIAAFLGGLLTTDGGVYKRSVRWNTSSRVLATQIKHLLLRLGIVGVLGEVTTNIGTTAYTINVYSQEQHLYMLRHINPYISSRKKAEELIEICGKKQLRKRHDNSIPRTKELEAAILDAMERNGGWPKVWGGFSRNKLFRRSGKISRALLRVLAEGMRAPKLLLWADSHIRWEPIVEIEELGEQDCIDIGVSGDHNFLVGDIITHNSMKSWVLAFLICWFYWHDKRVLIYTKEMTAENIFMRVAACIAQIEYHGLRMGTLSPEQELELYSARNSMRDLRMHHNLVCLSGQDAPKGMDTVSWIRAKIEHHKPDIAAIDGMYLLSDGKKGRSREERITNISRDMRQMILACARSKRPCPVIATFQATRGASDHNRGEFNEIAYSDAIGQDTTLAFRVINDVKSPTISMVMAGAREFELNGFRIHGMPATNFGFHSLLSAKDIDKAKEHDTGDIDNPKAHAKKKNNSDPKEAMAYNSAIRGMKDRM